MKVCARIAWLLGVAVLASCGVGRPVYRASVKLLIGRAGASLSGGELVREDDERFIATQVDIMQSQTILRRVQDRMKKTPEEIRDNLADLKVTPVRGSDIIVVSVDSPSADFAKDFANALTEEFLKFRDEQRAATTENALSQLTQETHRLGEELKAANEKLAAFDKEHNISTNPTLSELQALFEDRERVQGLYDASMARLMKADVARSAHDRYVSVLEPAILEPNRVH